MAGIPALSRLAGPFKLTGSVFSLYSPAAGLWAVIQQLHAVNTTASPASLSAWVGAFNGTAAGTEIVAGLSIPANSVLDEDTCERINAGEFLVVQGLGITLTVLGELYDVVG